MSLELVLPGAAMQRGIQRAMDLVAFGLQAAEGPLPAELSVPNTFGQVISAPDRAKRPEEAREEFRAWVIANGLRECVEAVAPALEWARRFCFLWTRDGAAVPLPDGKCQLQARISGEEWNKEIVVGGRKFDRLPFPEKIEALRTAYGFEPPELTPHAVSLNAARNCLSHRSGLVGEADLKAPGDPGLVMKWRRLRLSIGEGAEARILDKGSRVEAGDLLKPEIVDTERTIPVGERIIITANEYVEMALTFLFFGMQLQASAEAVQNRRKPAVTVDSEPGGSA